MAEKQPHPRMTVEYARKRMRDDFVALSRTASEQVSSEPDFVDICFELIDKAHNAYGIFLEYGNVCDLDDTDRRLVENLLVDLREIQSDEEAYTLEALYEHPKWNAVRVLARKLVAHWQLDRLIRESK